MLISTHVLSGALLGRALGRPVPALLLGVASHLALDRLPHWGHAHGWPPRPMDDDVFRVAAVDGVAGLALIALVARATGRTHLLPVLAGVAGACAPDLDKPGLRWFGRSPWPQRFDRFHAEIQVDVEKAHLLGQDVVVAALLAAGALRLLAQGRPSK